MSKRVVLVTLDEQDSDAKPFRVAVEGDALLSQQIELRFATGDQIEAEIAEAEVVCCGNLSASLVERANRLRWISFWSAGLDGKVTPQLLERNLLLTTASGVHGANIAEHVMGWMLMFTRGMHHHLRGQLAHEWRRDKWSVGAGELTGQTLGIIGLGHIGEGLAFRARAFGMRVIATKRNPETRFDPSISIDAIYPPSELKRLLAESDHVCVAVPYAPSNHHLLNAEMLGAMKPTAYLYNIARGKVIDEEALITALSEERIAGAGLDVFEQEPLPSESPLWGLPNVLISPHVAGVTPHYFARAAQLFTENLHRYLREERLNNLYDAEKGY